MVGIPVSTSQSGSPNGHKDRIFLFVFGGRDANYEDDELAYRNVHLACVKRVTQRWSCMVLWEWHGSHRAGDIGIYSSEMFLVFLQGTPCGSKTEDEMVYPWCTHLCPQDFSIPNSGHASTNLPQNQAHPVKRQTCQSRTWRHHIPQKRCKLPAVSRESSQAYETRLMKESESSGCGSGRES